MAKENRICFTCGKKHSYCPTCYDDRELESWHIMFDTENCKNIFNIINQYYYKHITIEEVIIQLEKCDLSIKFNSDIQIEIDKILSQKITKPTAEPVVKNKK